MATTKKTKRAKTAKTEKTAMPATSLKGDVTILHAFPLGRDTGLVSVNEYNGRRGLDIRRFYAGDDGILNPTGKGLRIPLEEVESLIAALSKAVRDGRIV